MRILIRILLLFSALALLALQVGFVLGASWATLLWPWPDTPLTYLFVASILAAVALPIAWVALFDELAALAGGALDFIVMYLAVGAGMAWFFDRQGLEPLNPITLFAAFGVALNLMIYLFCRRLEFRDRRPMPGLVRWSFLLFAVLLIGVAGALFLQLPAVFPWPLKPQTSLLIGSIFLGAAVYFIYGFAVPLWSNAAGQLFGFLAYDAVLLGPFIAHFDKVKEAHWLSLSVYVAVLVYSSVLALYFLCLHRPTRLSRGWGAAAKL